MSARMDELCGQNHLLADERDVIRVPFLVKGKLVLPPDMRREEIESAFNAAGPEARYVKLANAQLIREPVIDRATMRYTSAFAYQIMPAINPVELIEHDIDRLVRGPYALAVQDVLEYLRAVSRVLRENWATVDRVRQLARRTTEHPDVYLDAAFMALGSGLDPEAARAMLDNEWSVWTTPGARFLDGWVQVPANVIPGVASALAQAVPGAPGPLGPSAPAPALVRAMPTRQLHITAGNAPEIPIVTALRAVLTKSAAVIKSPHEATLSGALLALAAVAAAPDHPLTQNLSVVYWQGGDEAVERVLFMPNAFDRIVVWGAPDSVISVQSRALFTKIVCFNPRFGVSLIGREAFGDDLDRVAWAAAADAMIYSQKACTASLVQYVEGTTDQALAYAERLRAVLARWDELAPPFVQPAMRGQIKRMRRGKYSGAEWRTNGRDGEFASGVVVVPGEFDVLDHPMSRLVVIRPVDDLRIALRYLHQAVSTVGVFPEARRLALMDLIAARGVSNVLPLGQCERIYPGAPQDGMLVLNQLVDWKNA